MGDAILEPFLGGSDAAVCFSADFELLWAWRYSTPAPDWGAGRRTRAFFSHLLATFDEFRVPVTWATVGHLFLSACRRDDTTGRAHSEMERPSGHYSNPYWSFATGDWYDHDPCSSVEADPDWYAPDLVEQVLRSHVAHEIGSHSFSHPDFSDARCPPELARSELVRCQQEAERFGLRLRSFIFPGDFQGNLRAVREAGFTAYRGSDAIDLAYPERDAQGLWNIRESMVLFARDVDYRRRIGNYIKRALGSHTVLNLAFHPSDPDESMIAGVLRPSLAHIAQLRDVGQVWTATMGQIADYCEARRRVAVIQKSTGTYDVEWNLDLESHPQAAVTLNIPRSEGNLRVEIDGKSRASQPAVWRVTNSRVLVTLRPPERRLRVLSR